VFATTVTRDAAFGGTGEKTLAEGQFAYIEATNTTQYYDGAAWQSVGTTPGFVCVKAETAFSAASSVTADSVFTSTYTNYRVLLRYTTTTDPIAFQLGVATVYATTNYNIQRLDAAAALVDTGRTTSQSSARIAGSSNGSFTSSAAIELSGPQLAEPTLFQATSSRSGGAYTSPIVELHNGNHSTATAYDGLKLLVASGTMTGSYTIYGYSKTV
jgi:hypothetical protein